MSASPPNAPRARSRLAPRALTALGLILGLAGASVWRASADPGPRRLLEPTAIDLTAVGRHEYALTAPERPGEFEVVVECERTDALPFAALDRALLGDDRTDQPPTLRATARVVADGADLGVTNVVGGRWGRRTVGRCMAGFAATPDRAHRLVIEVEAPAPELAVTTPTVTVVEAFDKDRFVESSIHTAMGRLSALPLLAAGLLLLVGGPLFEWRSRRAAAPPD